MLCSLRIALIVCALTSCWCGGEELLQQLKSHGALPLSSDAHTLFGTDHATEHNEQVMEATKLLTQALIPRWAQQMEQMFESIEAPAAGANKPPVHAPPIAPNAAQPKKLDAPEPAAEQRSMAMLARERLGGPAPTQATAASFASTISPAPQAADSVSPPTTKESGPIPSPPKPETFPTLPDPRHYRMSEELHKWGINVRHLGLVRRHLSPRAHTLRMLILLEMVGRTLKNVVRAAMRGETWWRPNVPATGSQSGSGGANAKQHAAQPPTTSYDAKVQIEPGYLPPAVGQRVTTTPPPRPTPIASVLDSAISDDPRDAVVQCLNLITGGAAPAQWMPFWQRNVIDALTLRFGQCALEPAERTELYQIVKPALDRTVRYVCDMTGIKLAESAERCLMVKARGFEFVAGEPGGVLPH
jgi:hypothetical protein